MNINPESYEPSIPPQMVPPPVTGPGDVLPPPISEPPPAPGPKQKDQPQWIKKLGPVGAFLAAVGAKIKAVFAFVLPVLKFLKLGKILLTSGTMLLSVWFYSLLFGWPFAVGFVVLILIHEMGHVLAAYCMGLPVSAPIFIPGMGALILNKRGGSLWQQAIVGIGGPFAGFLASGLTGGIYFLTDKPIFLGLAYVGFFINLFNMTPVMPLDGGWITGAISPILWIIGLLILVGMAITGNLTNPLIYVLLILSLPRMWIRFQEWRAGKRDPIEKYQKIEMGLFYVGLIALLVIGMQLSFGKLESLKLRAVPQKNSKPVASSVGKIGSERSLSVDVALVSGTKDSVYRPA